MPPLVHFQIDGDGTDPFGPLRDDDLCSALVELLDDPVGIGRLVAKQGIEPDADGVIAVSRQQHEAHQVAQGIGERDDLGRPATLGLAYGLILSPPFAP